MKGAVPLEILVFMLPLALIQDVLSVVEVIAAVGIGQYAMEEDADEEQPLAAVAVTL